MDFLNVQTTLSHLEMKRSYRAAEFGCGTAEFALGLAKKLDRGKVYAIDIQQEKLTMLKKKMALAHITNIVTIVCDLEMPRATKLPDHSLDIVLIPNLLFQVKDRHGIINEAKRVLKPGGQLLVIDWSKSSPLGPKEGIIGPKEMKEMVSASGFSLTGEFSMLNGL